MTNIDSTIAEYIDFKIKQYIRITGFNTKQENSKELLKAEIKPSLKQWTAEALYATA